MAPPPEPLLECAELPPDEELLPLPMEEEVADVELEEAVSLLVVPLVEVAASVEEEFAVRDVESVVFKLVLWVLAEVLVSVFMSDELLLAVLVSDSVSVWLVV